MASPIVTFVEARRASKSPMIEGVCIAFTLLVTAVVYIRFHVRYSKKVGLGWDDCLAAMSWLFILAQLITICIMANNGLGRHVDLISLAQEKSLLKLFFASNWFYPAAVSCAKLSILLLYKCIFIFSNMRWFAITCWGIGIHIVLWTVASYLVNLLVCLPVPRNWSTTDMCHADRGTIISIASLNVVSSVAVLVAPLPVIWSLTKTRKDKIKFGFAFTLGFTSCGISIARTILAPQIYNMTDPSYDAVNPTILSLIEPITLLICASIPMLPTFFDRLHHSTTTHPFLAYTKHKVNHLRRSLPPNPFPKISYPILQHPHPQPQHPENPTEKSLVNPSMPDSTTHLVPRPLTKALTKSLSTKNLSKTLTKEKEKLPPLSPSTTKSRRTTGQSIFVTTQFSVDNVARSYFEDDDVFREYRHLVLPSFVGKGGKLDVGIV